MQCEQARLQLRQNDGKQDQQYSDTLFDHLSTCQDCWNHGSALWQKEADRDAVQTGIRSIDVDSALERAWNAQPGRKTTQAPRLFRHLAAAAMVVVAVSAVFQQFRNSAPELPAQADPAVIVISPATVRQVDFLLTSATAYSDAVITLALDDNLALSGYPGLKEISWPTSLQAGDNQLTLPLELRNGQQGTLTVNVRSGDLQKQMMFTVQPPQQDLNAQVI